ncbi:MAG: amidohydrolase family protein, partial [Anaerolineae bacterium]|nr:amidohydrolase family protein [Anaerolineae bacterium]
MHDFLPGDLVPLMKQTGFEGTVAVQARTILEETRWLLDLAEHNKFIKGVVGWVDLCDPELSHHLEVFSADPVFCGVRTHIRTDPADADRVGTCFLKGMEVLGAYDTAFDILIRPEQLSIAYVLTERFPEQVFVLDHIANPPINPPIKEGSIDSWATDIRNLACLPNVYCKVSGMVTRGDHEHWSASDFKPYLDVVFDAFGVQRLMIGSDWPVCTQAASYQQTMALVVDAVQSLVPDSQDAVLGGTAARAYGLNV